MRHLVAYNLVIRALVPLGQWSLNQSLSSPWPVVRKGANMESSYWKFENIGLTIELHMPHCKNMVQSSSVVFYHWSCLVFLKPIKLDLHFKQQNLSFCRAWRLKIGVTGWHNGNMLDSSSRRQTLVVLCSWERHFVFALIVSVSTQGYIKWVPVQWTVSWQLWTTKGCED